GRGAGGNNDSVKRRLFHRRRSRSDGRHQAEETSMKMVSVLLVSCTLAFMPGDYPMAQGAGSTRLGVSIEEVKIVASGWSAKKQILGKTVFNENNENVGKIDDLIVAPTGELSFVIIGAGGF